MEFFKNEVWPLLRHLVGTFVAAVVLFLAAIGLAYVEKWCVDNQMPEYLCLGTRGISFVLFSFDGILICGTAGITTFKLLRRTWKNDN